MSSEPEREPDEADEIPRQGFWASMPKSSLSRVIILLALLAAILYLRQRTGTIAACMSGAFQAPAPAQRGVRLKSPVGLPPAGPRETP
jgi:hypothetical protein